MHFWDHAVIFSIYVKKINEGKHEEEEPLSNASKVNLQENVSSSRLDIEKRMYENENNHENNFQVTANIFYPDVDEKYTKSCKRIFEFNSKTLRR
ncbi:hypothetical protein B6U79_01825 [Candidatus Bathyarchaeota archaeon ex4484_231]|nr:MAG: hypothetical protein B6U79_01825 [Candidatus Bathyarchaeota archaeon ex4484_231]